MNKRHIVPIYCMMFMSNFLPTTSNATEDLTTTEDLLELSLDELMQVKIVTIASGVEQLITKAPAVATVITAKDIEATGATNIEEALSMVPGLHVLKYFIGYEPIYAIRGIYLTYNPHVLILINGIPMTRLYLGNRGLVGSDIPINNVERIEVIRGPGSAMYGAEAFAGVINVITKTRKEIGGTEAGLRLGSYNTRDGWILQGYKWGKVDVAAALEFHDTDGSKEIIQADLQTALDKLYGTHASLAPGPLNLQQRGLNAYLDLSYDRWQLRLGYQERRNVGVGTGHAQVLDSTARFAEDRLNADLTYHDVKFTENWDVTAQLSVSNVAFWPTDNLVLYPPGAFKGAYPEGYIGNPSVSERHTRLTLSGFYKGFTNHLLRVGTGFFLGDLYKVRQVSNFGVNPATGKPLPPGSPLMDLSDTPGTFISENTRKNWFLFVQDSYTLTPDWELTAGLRYDKYSDFGNTVNPRFALVWQTHPKLTSKLLYGRAFRAPSFYELYAANNPVSLGNPDLQPETIDMVELAFNYHPTEQLQFSTNLFTYEMNDIINYSAASGNAIKATNSGTQRGHGLEFESQWKVTKNFSMIGNYSFQRSESVEQDHDIGYAPHHSVYLRGDWLFLPDWHLNTEVNWVADRERPLHDPRPPLDDYTIVDLTLHYKQFHEHWSFSLAARNLFDVDAREPSPEPRPNGAIGIPNDLPLAGRNYWLEVSYRF
ncbi:MAG: hypothetical protein BWK79_08240 [Beggiatoa sp. IS2]|nr:MAG: hypothetical protein BWK79_08240 [Beggiatoa sp. IS2]